VTPNIFFSTSRLIARGMALADVEPFVAYRSNADVARYQSWENYTLEEGRALVEEMQASRPGIPGAWYQFALENVTSGELVGDLAARINPDEHRELEVGFTLAPQHQGKGYGTEALTGLLGYAFDSLGVRRVIAVTDALNFSAAALLTRVGMRQEAHFKENVFFKGSWGSEFVFALLASEWPVDT